jgi:hypothetical protein
MLFAGELKNEGGGGGKAVPYRLTLIPYGTIVHAVVIVRHRLHVRLRGSHHSLDTLPSLGHPGLASRH